MGSWSFYMPTFHCAISIKCDKIMKVLTELLSKLTNNIVE